tara:strand:- start:1143 stop:2072 length:930 start_codon:yes stop_codon:yes gene_type:complete
MAVINTIASKSAGCGGEEINTGDLGCDIAFGLVTHALGLSKGVVIAKETELSLSVIEALVQKGDIIPLMDAFSSEPTMSEDTLETSPLGVEALTLKGLPKYSLTMKKGQNYYKQMAKLTGFGNINYVLGDVNGNWKFAVTSSGDFTGFTAGQTLAAMTTPATATETEKKTFTFQLTDRKQIDSTYAVIESANAFPISHVTGINGVQFSFENANGLVVPAAGDTTLQLKVVLESDRITEIEGLVLANFTTSAGTISAAVDNGNGFYSLTVGSLTPGLLTVATKDAAVGVNVIKVSSALYRSNLLSATVAS